MAILSRILPMNFIFHRCRLRFIAWGFRAGWFGFLLFAALASVGTVSAQPDRPPDYRIKAAFLYHFGQFVEWPANAFANAGSPLIIGVLGDDPFHGDLEGITAGKSINGHPVVVRHIKALSDVKGCHILFIAASEKDQEREVLKSMDGASVLTVGETDDFIQAGGMINFIIEDSQVHFQINNDAARAVGLKISSKLIKLSRPG